MAKRGFQSKYAGTQFDEAIEYFLNQHDLSTIETVVCGPDNKIDLDAYNVEEGIYIINYFYHSADDADTSPIMLFVIFLDDHTVLQRYNLNGTDVCRKYSDTTNEYSEWLPMYEVITASNDEEVQVPKDTLVLRSISTREELIRQLAEGGMELHK